eukprot:4679317-Amphidinium_carterae.1
MIETLSSTRPIEHDSFIPTNSDNDTTQYLWWSWFTDAQLTQFRANGTVPPWKETRGDNVHKHHRFHNRPDHCVNLAMHCRWNRQANDKNTRKKLLHLMVWKQSIAHTRRSSDHAGCAYSSIYYRWAEGDPLNMQLRNLMGNDCPAIHLACGTWRTGAASTIQRSQFFGWTAQSVRGPIRVWCENNELKGVINKHLEADGTVKAQYVTADSVVERDHQQAMSLHNWHSDNELVVNSQHVTMRVSNAGNGTELQWNSPVTSMHSSITMIVEKDT